MKICDWLILGIYLGLSGWYKESDCGFRKRALVSVSGEQVASVECTGW